MRRAGGAVLLVTFALLAAPLPAAAATLGVDITTNGLAETSATSFTLGWAVDVITPVRVTALGVWDEGSNGLQQSHAVGLWTGSGTLLASTTVPAGSGADSAVPSALGAGQWLFEDISDVVLQVGHYVLGSVSTGDEFRAFQGGIILDDALANLDSGKFAVGGNLQFPNLDEADFGIADEFSLFGPDFLLEPVTTPAPLPASLALFGLGLLAFGARWAIRKLG